MQIYKKLTKRAAGFFKQFSSGVSQLSRPSLEGFVDDLAYEAKRNLVLSHLKFLSQKADLEYCREAAFFLEYIAQGNAYDSKLLSSIISRPIVIRPKSELEQPDA